MTLHEFLWSAAPAPRVRRRFWTKVVVLYLWIGALTTLVVMFESTPPNRFVAVLLAIAAVISVIVLGAVWRFREPCPRCAWNLNLTNKPYLKPAISVPSSCPNYGLDLIAKYPVPETSHRRAATQTSCGAAS